MEAHRRAALIEPPLILRAFATWWLGRPRLTYEEDTHAEVAGFRGTTLYRDDRGFQVQMWLCPPLSRIGEHAHPTVDGYAVAIAGEIVFTVSGRAIRVADCALVNFGTSQVALVPVAAGVPHAARIGIGGGTFFAITHWRGPRAPRSVHLDWTGPALDPAHAAELAKD